MKKIKLGAVPYLNVGPLAYPLENEPGVEIVRAKPSELPEMLISGEVHAATLPIAAFLADERFELISDAVIASSGPVRSVAIFSRKPLEETRVVALDRASITSRALTRIVFEKFLDLKPKYIEAPAAAADAELVIGDDSLRRESSGESIYDLGEIWTARTGLPFVYAAWTAVAGKTDGGETARMLNQARDTGTAGLEQISAAAANRAGFSAEFVLKYLKNNIHYTLGRRELEGVALFQDYLLEIGVLNRRREIEIRNFGPA